MLPIQKLNHNSNKVFWNRLSLGTLKQILLGVMKLNKNIDAGSLLFRFGMLHVVAKNKTIWGTKKCIDKQNRYCTFLQPRSQIAFIWRLERTLTKRKQFLLRIFAFFKFLPFQSKDVSKAQQVELKFRKKIICKNLENQVLPKLLHKLSNCMGVLKWCFHYIYTMAGLISIIAL